VSCPGDEVVLTGAKTHSPANPNTESALSNASATCIFLWRWTDTKAARLAKTRGNLTPDGLV